MSNTIQTVATDRIRPPLFAGIDVGGTTIKLGILDSYGRTIAFGTAQTHVQQGPQEGVKRIASLLKALCQKAGLADESIVRIGLGCPGLLDIEAGVFLEPVNLPGWAGFPVRDSLAVACHCPVVFVNDATAATLAEAWVGSGKHVTSLVMLTLGTGVGAGIVIDGKIVSGNHGFGGEIGHVVVETNPDARLCACGRRGCLEAYCSATALMARAKEVLKDWPDPRTPLALAERAEAGDQVAEELILEMTEYLARGIVTVMHVLDPGAILIGGAMTFGRDSTRTGQEFLKELKKRITQRTFPSLAQALDVRFASLGGDAGYIGAAAWARTQHRAGTST